MLGLVILVLVLLAGWYLLNRLKQLEIEIRSELDEAGRTAASESPSASDTAAAEDAAAVVTDSAAGSPQPVDAGADSASDLGQQLLDLVHAHPGELQTALYDRFPDQSRKQLQSELLRLARSGRLRREKSGGSYRLYPG